MEYSMRHIGQITGGKWLQLVSDDSIGQLLLDSRRLRVQARREIELLVPP